MKVLILILSLVVACLPGMAQEKKSVVIGTLIERPNAVLVINPPNSDQGFLLPQLTSKERTLIEAKSPADDGLMVFDTDDKNLYYFSRDAWVPVAANDGTGTGGVLQSLMYDGLTQRLTLSGGSVVDLSTLKETPSQTGHAGKFLTTNGTTLSWATVTALGDITAINTPAGSALSGGVSSGDATLSVNTDGSSITVNGSNQLQLANNAVTLPKIATGGNNKILTTSSTGAVQWSDLSSLPTATDAQNLNLTGNALGIQNGTGVNLSNLTTSGDVAGALNAQVIQNGAVNSAKIQDGTIATNDLASGGNSKFLTTSTTGTVQWSDLSSIPGSDNQNLSLTGNALGIEDGSGVDLNALSTAGDVAGPLNAQVIQNNVITSLKILDGTITGADLANQTITGGKIGDNEIHFWHISSGGNNKLLGTNAGGNVTWLDQSVVAADDQSLSLTGNALAITDGTGVDLNNLTTNGDVTGALNSQVIQVGAVTSGKILDGTIATVDIANNAITNDKIGDAEVSANKISSGGFSKVLTTDALGAVVWEDKGAFAGGSDSQTLTLNSNLLTIDNGNSVDMNNLLVLGDVQGNLNNAIIQPGTVTSSKIADGSVAPVDLASGTSNQVLVTNTAGTAAQWSTPGGDVTGPVSNARVVAIQGNPVSTTAPTVGQAMVWDGSNWVPTTLTGVGPAVQYLGLDPSSFKGLQEDGNKDASLGIMESNLGQFAFGMDKARYIVAPVNLPDGATIQNITAYIQYTTLLGLLGPMEITLVRKPYGGGASNDLATITPLLSIGVFNYSSALSTVVDNASYTYRVIVRFRNSGDADRASNAIQRLYGVRIQYLK